MEIGITVKRSDRRTIAIEVKNGAVLVRAPRYASRSEIEHAVQSHISWIERALQKEQDIRSQGASLLTESEKKALKKSAKETIPARIAYYAQLMGLSYGTISIRFQKTRWGSCSAKHNLNFNALLMLTPPEVLDSVVVHELCHIKVMNHSAAFYREVYRWCPDYKKCSKWLKDHGKALMARL